MSSLEKSVTFGDIEIRDYPIILGDNPACTGCPISIDWKSTSQQTRNMELYEYTRAQQGRKTGKGKKLVIPVQARSQMLLDAGYTQEQIIERALEVAEIKRLREESAKDSSNPGGFQKVSKNIVTGFNNLTFGFPKPLKRSFTARTA